MHVSIHAPAWGATQGRFRVCTSRRVSIHAPAWGATPSYSPPPADVAFQFTLPRGERPLAAFALCTIDQFQFTLPRGERHPALKKPSGSNGFNSRSRVGSDLSGPLLTAGVNVSIHAPAWGATVETQAAGELRWVSIHAPAWGATRLAVSTSERVMFQFTLPRGERHGRFKRGSQTGKFQFTLPRGERPRATGPKGSDMKFQFTLPRGERRRHAAPPTAAQGSFNSRSRVGSDPSRRAKPQRRRVSIHAPAWGATPAPTRPSAPLEVSIHAPAWGATSFAATGGLGCSVSIHAPAWGATARQCRPY